MSDKLKYRVRNWRQYNEALKRRGSLTLWFNEATLSSWYAEEKTGHQGRDLTYSDLAIQCLLTLKVFYGLPLRADLRQQRTLRGKSWRKLHLGVDEASGQVVAALVTLKTVGDSEVFGDLLDQVADPVGQVSADGAYDTRRVYRATLQRGAKPTIPPRSAAVAREDSPEKPEAADRNQVLETIQRHGRRAWERDSGYRRRNLAETTMWRIKGIFGRALSARLFDYCATRPPGGMKE